MRVSFISNLYGANARGGAERIVMTEAEGLAGRGHDVTVIAASGDAQGPEDPAGPVRVVRVRPKNLYFYTDGERHGISIRLLWHLRDMLNAGSARMVTAALGETQPDVVHTHNLMGIGFLVPRAVRRSGSPHVHTVHDVQLIHPSGLIAADDRRPGTAAMLVRALYIACMRRLMGSPKVVIFPSKFLADLHARHGFFRRSRVEVLANPVPSPIRPPSPPAERKSVLYVGQLEAHKGIRVLLDAWERAPDSGMTLEIAGTGALEEEVRSRAGRVPRVTVHGFLTGTALEEAYARAAYVVVPSVVIENQPTVIIEAYARGIPVVASAAGGIPELVDDGLTGLLFPPGDADALAAALTAAPLRLKDADAVGSHIAERLHRHDAARHLGLLEDIYRSLTGTS